MKEDAINAQEAHYESIHDAYRLHYYDAPSMEYRHKFILRPLVEGIDLNDATVADLACGSGQNSLALRSYFPGIRTTGYDISEPACRDYRANTGGDAFQVDLTRPFDDGRTYDAAIVIGGLHHCIADLGTTLTNVARMVRPGGTFLMMEPSDDFFLSSVRRLWYKKDKWFEADTEDALKHDEISRLAEPYFAPKRVQHVGGPAFYLILNSLVTRVPLKIKPTLSTFLFPMENLYNMLPGRAPFAIFLAQWTRTDTAVDGEPSLDAQSTLHRRRSDSGRPIDSAGPLPSSTHEILGRSASDGSPGASE